LKCCDLQFVQFLSILVPVDNNKSEIDTLWSEFVIIQWLCIVTVAILWRWVNTIPRGRSNRRWGKTSE